MDLRGIDLGWAGLDWRGPDIRSGLVKRHLIIEGKIIVSAPVGLGLENKC